jgi:hypothetical protein
MQRSVKTRISRIQLNYMRLPTHQMGTMENIIVTKGTGKVLPVCAMHTYMENGRTAPP